MTSQNTVSATDISVHHIHKARTHDLIKYRKSASN